MSEELIQKGLDVKGIVFGDYELFLLGSTTINQLKRAKIIPSRDYKDYGRLKPDAVIVDRRNKKDIRVIAVIEYKTHSDFDTKNKIEEACKQCNTYCEVLGASMGIVTDGNDHLWINPQRGFEESVIRYNDTSILGDKFDKQRGFDFIKREDGYNLVSPFVCDVNREEDTRRTLIIIGKVLRDISADNTSIKKEEYKNPTRLARSVWQLVWMATSASPERSLSTFIEIFMFKFLSDLGVLKEDEKGNEVSFEAVTKRTEKNCLKYYFDNVRDYIKQLFPVNPQDDTTLINGINLNPDVKEDNIIFHKILNKFNEFGSLKNIDPEFKSRLFEDFLKKNISKKNWGQFFTPRNVVKAIIEMSDIEKLPDGAKVCDPACGVGGFILEPLLTKRPNDYYFKDSKLQCKLDFVGYEKGFEQDEKLTTALAKANLIVYLSELLQDNPTLTSEFARVFNKTFRIYTKTILGSLSDPRPNEYDLIMSNPPYVVSGSSIYKDAVKADAGLSNFYKVNATGAEGLFLEKMINELKPGGSAFVIIPDGLLVRKNDEKLREHIIKECTLNGIISLPSNTFYTTPKKTYIISLSKNNRKESPDNYSVFTYLVSNIGESLDVNRFVIPENDLKDMVLQYKYFMIDKPNYRESNKRCKIVGIEQFKGSSHWAVDRWWSKEEKVELGIEEAEIVLSEEEFYERIYDIQGIIGAWLEDYKDV